ncbi:MAG: response regulator [Prolixibacteraceae bacterium]|nr:response regulator [Prolixibacteraceae bacterium]
MSEFEKPTILYVDDEESNLRIFKNTFRKKYNVITASSALEGLKILEDQDIDLIMSDQRMPGMSGIEFLKLAFQKYPDLNRILVTAYSDYDILKDAVNEIKIFQYIEKPWNEDDIQITIDNALEIHRLQSENQKLTRNLIESNEELLKKNEELNQEIGLHKKTQLELIKEKEYAESCNRLKSAFLANMSHEIRTPMNSIMGFLSIIEDEELPTELKKEYMQIIQSSCTQLLHIIDDIIEISKIDTGNVELRMETFSLNSIMERLYDRMILSLKGSSIEFNLVSILSEDKQMIYSDPVRLEQILSHLLINAIKFTEKGKIQFGVNIDSNYILFFVKDTGIGIAEENFEMIFNRFSQVENAIQRKHGGNGLGLAIAKAYVIKLGGEIWVESQLDKGSVFYFKIPYMKK